MNWVELFPQHRQPTPAQIAEQVASPLWSELCAYLEGEYQVEPRVEYSCCSAAPGWNVKYKKSGRALCTLYPQCGGFSAMVSVGSREALEAEYQLAQCGDYVRELYAASRPFNGGRWLMISVTTPQILADVKRLIALRMHKPRGRRQA